MNYIYFTKRFREDIEGIEDEGSLLKRVKDLEKYDNASDLKSVSSIKDDKLIVYKLSKNHNCRVIIQIQTIVIEGNEIEFRFVMQYVPKSDFGYKWKSVIYPSLQNGMWIIENSISNEESEEAKEEYISLSLKDRIPKEPPPYGLTKWLEKFSAKIKFDIFEYENWVKYSSITTPNGLEVKYELFFKKLIKAIINNKRNVYKWKEINNNLYSIINEEEGPAILFSKHEILNRKDPLFVIRDGANINSQKNRWENIISLAKDVDVDSENNLKEISKKAFRAYEKWILNDPENDSWETIQRFNGNHNLSLLPEQIDFLNDFQFPVYINGQAGSGKSTMLYYLFANVFTSKIAGEFEGDIIFLTENENLLKQTRASILGLLNSNSNFHLDLTVEQKSEIKDSFYSFNEFLLKIIPDNEKDKYPREKFMDFAKFKSLYTKDHKRKYSAEEAWFVINTYVLGYTENIVIDTREKYETHVVKEYKTVDGSTFTDIVNNTFPFFKKLILENKFWTKTTLVRQIRKLFPNDLPVNYVSVFCDEAQDFTKIELRLIIHSSEFMRYDLSHDDKIPIVFAGDALQTVSPNRFTMVRLKQMFYNIFGESKFDYNSEIQDRTVYTPKFNYRSSGQIVRIANVIQQYRQQFLKEDMYVKQESKRTESSNLNPMLHYKEWLIKDENFDSFEKKFRYKSFIIPTDLNEEEIYIKGEDLLSKNQKNINSKLQSLSYFSNIKSSINAKGAEYSQVVVYGFGDYHLKHFGKLSEENQTNDFKLKFFFNKLYVAITRAQNELIIIDSEESSENFWIPLFNAIQTLSEPWESFQDLEDIILIDPETLDDVTTSSKEDAIENAKRDMEQGILDGNATRLKVASNTFEILGFEKEANDSLGHVELIKGNWNKAGEYFKRAEKMEKAADAFFKGRMWNKLPRTVSGSIHKGRVLIASLMSTGSWGEEDITQAYDLRDSIYKALNGIDWYKDFSKKVIAFIKSKKERKRDLAIIVESIIKDSDIELRQLLANLYFQTSQYEKAILCWEKYILDQEIPIFPENYIISKIEIYENEGNKIEKLLWLGRLFLTPNFSEKNKLTTYAKEYLTLYEELDLKGLDEINLREITEQLFTVYTILGKRDFLHEVAREVEQNQKISQQVLIFYRNAVQLTNDKTIINFIKRRWIYTKLNLIKNEKSLTNINSSIVEELNLHYQAKKFPFIENEPSWSERELEELNEIPNPISNFPPNHLTEISIFNYRKLEKIELSNIGKYNLILGDNNSGKTTLLEALMFSHIPNQQFINLLYTHNLRKNGNIGFINEGVEIIKESKNNKADLNENIVFDIVSGRQNWSYILRHPTIEEIRNKTKIDDSNPNKYIVLESKTSNSKIEFSDPVNLLKENKDVSNIPFVPFGKGYSSELADIYFRLIGSDRKLRRAFYKHLQTFIPNLVEITINPDTNTIIIEEESNEGDFSESPLYNYGEGANKLFRIIVQIYASRGKRLMIDEIDAGIHFSRFKNFWEVILKIAMDLKVQLFVSTHNEECIKFFYEVLLTEELNCCRADSRVITLEYIEEEKMIVPIVRDFDNINYAIVHDLEIRGNE